MQILIPRASLDTVLVCDPASSIEAHASRTAIVVVSLSPGSRIFVREAWAQRESDPFTVIQHMLACSLEFQPRCWGVETVGYQATLQAWSERMMRERGVFYPVIPLKPDRYEKKADRIMSLQPFARSGQLYIQRGMLKLIEEWEAFPDPSTPRDLLDALAYAVRLLVPQAMPTVGVGLGYRLAELAKRDPASARYWRKDAETRGLIEPEATLDEMLGGEGQEETAGLGLGEWA